MSRPGWSSQPPSASGSTSLPSEPTPLLSRGTLRKSTCTPVRGTFIFPSKCLQGIPHPPWTHSRAAAARDEDYPRRSPDQSLAVGHAPLPANSRPAPGSVPSQGSESRGQEAQETAHGSGNTGRLRSPRPCFEGPARAPRLGSALSPGGKNIEFSLPKG